MVPLDQLKDDDFSNFAKKWLTGEVDMKPSNSTPKVYDAPGASKSTIDKKLSSNIPRQHQIIMKTASDSSEDGIELELQMLDHARRKSSQLGLCNDSFLSRSSMNSIESNRNMYTQSLVDRMSSDGERSTVISYPFWTPSTAKGTFYKD